VFQNILTGIKGKGYIAALVIVGLRRETTNTNFIVFGLI
jgi:hypothetical protein